MFHERDLVEDDSEFLPRLHFKRLNNITYFGQRYHEHQKTITPEDFLKAFRFDACKDKPILAVLPDKAMGADNYDHWSWKTLCEMRTLLLKQGIPFFPTVKRAAIAAYKAAEYYALNKRK